LPPSSLSRGFNSVKSFFSYFLPRNLSLEPFSSYYIDNLKYRLFSYGAKLDAAFAGILSLGAYWEKTNLNNPIIDKDFIKYRGLAAIYFSKYLSVNGSYGVLNIYGEPDKKFGDAALTYLSPEQFSATFSYENNDARMVLYSPFIINNRIEINNYRLKAAYNYLDAASFTGIYNYFNLSDKNEGNDLQIRLGKKFLVNGIFGYEFYFSDYSFISAVYDSPQNYSSHCLWTEWIWNYSNYKIKADARIGYSPSVNYILSEVFGEVTYNPIGGLLLTLKLGYSNSYRFDAGYQSYFASVMAYWGVF